MFSFIVIIPIDRNTVI